MTAAIRSVAKRSLPGKASPLSMRSSQFGLTRDSPCAPDLDRWLPLGRARRRCPREARGQENERKEETRGTVAHGGDSTPAGPLPAVVLLYARARTRDTLPPPG